MRSHHALDHLELQHKMHVAHALGVAREVKEKRRGDVVRQVAHDAHAARKNGVVELERVGLVDLELRGKARYQIAIDLDHFKAWRFLDKQAAEDAFAGPDLDDEIFRCRLNRIDDLLQDPRIVEEMLAEPLTRTVQARWQA